MGKRVFLCCSSAAHKASISSRVVRGEKLMRMVPAATFFGRFIALKTWLGWPLWQAEPAETQMPCWLKSFTMLPLGYPGRETVVWS